MEVLVDRGAGLDVHRDFIECCAVLGPRKTDIQRQRFSTFPDELIRLREWVVELRCTHVVMESTSVFWRPVYDALEGHVKIVVCNAQHVKNVPGRKTDINDPHWLGILLRYGLVANSYVPPRPLRELRELTRYHTKLTHSRTAFLNRTHKTLQIGGIKLSSVVSETFGVSGRLMMEALIEGTESPEQMADLAKGVLRRKIPQLTKVLKPPLSEHRKSLLQMQLHDVDRLDASMAEAEALIDSKLGPHAQFLDRVAEMPGADHRAASILLAEIGPDMTPWQNDPDKLTAWAGVAPGNKASGGKRARCRTREGNPYVKTILVEIAQAAVRLEGGRFQSLYRTAKSRLGTKRALVKIARHWLRSFFFMMLRNQPYHEIPRAELDQQAKQKAAQKLIRKLAELGVVVTAPVVPLTA